MPCWLVRVVAALLLLHSHFWWHCLFVLCAIVWMNYAVCGTAKCQHYAMPLIIHRSSTHNTFQFNQFNSMTNVPLFWVTAFVSPNPCSFCIHIFPSKIQSICAYTFSMPFHPCAVRAVICLCCAQHLASRSSVGRQPSFQRRCRYILSLIIALIVACSTVGKEWCANFCCLYYIALLTVRICVSMS
jgi:hypothetical protein